MYNGCLDKHERKVLYVYMFQTIRVFGPYAYGLSNFKRLSRLQKYFTDQRYSNLQHIKKS